MRGHRVEGTAELRRHVNGILLAVSESRGVWICEMLNSSIKCSAVARARLEVTQRLRASVVRWDDYAGQPPSAKRHYRLVVDAAVFVGRPVTEDGRAKFQRLSYPDIGYLLGCTHGALVYAVQKAEREAERREGVTGAELRVTEGRLAVEC